MRRRDLGALFGGHLVDLEPQRRQHRSDGQACRVVRLRALAMCARAPSRRESSLASPSSRRLKRLLHLPQFIPMEYKRHAESLNDKSSFRNTQASGGTTRAARVPPLMLLTRRRVCSRRCGAAARDLATASRRDARVKGGAAAAAAAAAAGPGRIASAVAAAVDNGARTTASAGPVRRARMRRPDGGGSRRCRQSRAAARPHVTQRNAPSVAVGELVPASQHPGADRTYRALSSTPGGQFG